MDALRLPAALEGSRRILVAGAGGGFDVYAGLPIWARLRALGKDVFLANLTFTYLGGTDARPITRALYQVDAGTSGGDGYFPERTLARFLSQRGESASVYAFEKLGVAPVREGYQHLVQGLNLDAIVLVDGGTDVLMRGDEQGLGTPEEDMTSLAAVASLDVPTRIVTCVGFGIDAFHGVCHAHWLENVAALTAEGAFLGATALLERMPEVRLYLDAVDDADAATPRRPSIVNGSIASAVEGRFGDHHRGRRTRGSKLFINPLMSLLWAFDLPAVARRNLYPLPPAPKVLQARSRPRAVRAPSRKRNRNRNRSPATLTSSEASSMPLPGGSTTWPGRFLGASRRGERREQATSSSPSTHEHVGAARRPSRARCRASPASTRRGGARRRGLDARGKDIVMTADLDPILAPGRVALEWRFSRAWAAIVDRLASTQTIWDVQLAIEHFHASVKCRPREPIPH